MQIPVKLCIQMHCKPASSTVPPRPAAALWPKKIFSIIKNLNSCAIKLPNGVPAEADKPPWAAFPVSKPPNPGKYFKAREWIDNNRGNNKKSSTCFSLITEKVYSELSISKCEKLMRIINN